MTVPIVDPNPPGYVDATSREPGHFGKPYILTRIFDLLVLMIDVLQRTAAAQAERLNFLTQWQKAYTDELNQIHAFVQGNGDQTGNKGTGGFTGGPSIGASGGLAPSPADPNVLIYKGNENYLVSGSLLTALNAGHPQAHFANTYPSQYTVVVESGFKGAISGGSQAAIDARNALTTVNSTYTQQIQGNLNIISNDAKALQANVNQSNDSVQSQADMATAILQQMSTILTSIYQS